VPRGDRRRQRVSSAHSPWLPYAYCGSADVDAVVTAFVQQPPDLELAPPATIGRRLVLAGLDSLTPSERRIAQLAAAGLANRDIAQQLFITTRTVEGHLTHVYQKLDITSREQLPAALATPNVETTASAATLA
jgi:DNA-binding CsgD family transcriptional regulator